MVPGTINYIIYGVHFINRPIFHYEFYMFKNGDILYRIAFNSNNVGKFSYNEP